MTTKKDWWIVGQLHDPQPEDKLSYIYDLSRAVTEAKNRSGRDPREVIAVWDNSDDVVAVFTSGLQLCPSGAFQRVPIAKPSPVNHIEYSETIDISQMDGNTARDEVCGVLVRLREQAAEQAKQWLLHRGYFNGEILGEMWHRSETGTVDVKATLRDFGLIDQGVA